MASRYELEVTVTSAKDLKNVNWKYGPNKPYAVVWVDPANKCSTRVDEEGDTFPVWEHTLTIQLQQGVPIEDQTLFIDVVNAKAEEGTKPLIGSTKLRIRDVLDEAGFGGRVKKSLQLKRPSGRPHGKIDLKVLIRENRYQTRDAYYAPPYGVQPPPPPPAQTGTRDYYAAPPTTAYAAPYAQPQSPYYTASPPPTGYPYNAPPQSVQPSYGYGYGQQSGYGQQPVVEEQKKSKFGMGTGLAVGAVAGVLGGLALSEGVDALEDHIADEAADRVEDDDTAAYDDSGDW